MAAEKTFDETRKQITKTEGRFVFGWSEFKAARKKEVKDGKGRTVRIDDMPPKVITKMLVELEDGTCVPVNGEAFAPMISHSIPLPLKTTLPGKMKEMGALPSQAYKKGETVKIKKSVFSDGYVLYEELE